MHPSSATPLSLAFSMSYCKNKTKKNITKTTKSKRNVRSNLMLNRKSRKKEKIFLYFRKLA